MFAITEKNGFKRKRGGSLMYILFNGAPLMIRSLTSNGSQNQNLIGARIEKNFSKGHEC